MATYGVLGDIHGNREALEAVLAALDARGIERLLCVGDIVGYNADPDDCISMVYGRRCITIAGNHDLIAIGRLGFSRCANKAIYALKRTRKKIRPASAAWLAALPPHRVVDGSIALVHGGVRDVQQYMRTPAQIRENAEYLRADLPGARLCFFGHSHEQKVYEVDGDIVSELPGDLNELKSDKLYFINPGSVDASRKREHKLAEFAVLDTTARTIEFARTRYDAASTEIKAGMGGYRIGRWTDRAYSLQRRLTNALQKAIS